MMNGNLPDGWTETTLGEVAELVGGGTPSREHPEYFTGHHVWLTPTEIPRNRVTVVSTSREKITDEGLKKSSARLLPKGTVLMTSRASIGYVAIAGTEVTTNQGFASFICKDGVYNQYLAYWLLGNVDFFIGQATGTTFKEITKSKLRNFSFPLPPLPEQKRIVTKIEELFTQLEAGTAALERVQAGLNRYKASVLKAAVEGKLGIQNDEVRTQDEGQLPEGWKEVEFKEIITSLKNGYFYGRPSSEPIGIPILRISAVRPMSVNYSDLRYVPELKEEDVENYFLSKGDLLFTRYNGNLSLVGACGLVREGSQRVIYPDKLIRVRVQNENALPEYLEIYFSTILARKLIESKVKSTAGQHGISGGDIKSLSVILPPLEEQRQIVAEVERRLSLAAGVESTLAASLSRAGRLRQSILKSAFEGRLV